jgi:hypothetical protein
MIKASKPFIQNHRKLMIAFRINVTKTVSRGTPGWVPRETFRGYASTIFFIIKLVNIKLINFNCIFYFLPHICGQSAMGLILVNITNKKLLYKAVFIFSLLNKSLRFNKLYFIFAIKKYTFNLQGFRENSYLIKWVPQRERERESEDSCSR